MTQQFTLDQIEQLKSLGIKVDQNDLPVKEEEKPTEETKPIEPEPIKTETLPPPEAPLVHEKVEIEPEAPLIHEEIKLTESEATPTQPEDPNKKKLPPVFPLLSISGLTLLSFGGLVLLKGKGSPTSSVPVTTFTPDSSEVTPTQVPKSIQHYLLTSQQYFSQAVSKQSSVEDSSSTVELLNNSILAATEAIKEFPEDYRGYQQRGTIYQALTDSKPDLIDQSISDFTSAFKLNSNSAEVSRSLASLYAKKGDAKNTIAYLNQTVALEPTKAQNFYDLAKIQQQAGLLAQALDTYTKLSTLVTDPIQKAQVESEKSALEKLVAQNPASAGSVTTELPTDSTITSPDVDSPTIQASTGAGLIIASPEEDKSINVTNQTDSNSLSGSTTLPSNQKEIAVSNDRVTSTSQVYVTITNGGKNQNLQVLSKSDKSFVVGLDSPISEDIQFKWWIIN